MSKRKHEKRVKQAGCKHSAVYPDGALGWCKLCRALACEGLDRDRKN